MPCTYKIIEKPTRNALNFNATGLVKTYVYAQYLHVNIQIYIIFSS